MAKFTPKKELLKKEVLKRIELLTHSDIEERYSIVNSSSGPLSDKGLVLYNKCSQEAIDFYNAWVNGDDDITDAINDAWSNWAMDQQSLMEANPEEYGYELDDLDEDGCLPYDAADSDGWVYTSVKNMAKMIINDVMEELDWKRVYSIAKKRLKRDKFYIKAKINIDDNEINNLAYYVINDIKWEQPETLYANIKY